MNKLLYFNDLREDNKNKKDKDKCIISSIDFMKFEENKINKIIKEIFILENKNALIDMINYIYNDELSYNIDIEYLDEKNDINYRNESFLLKEMFCDIRILVKDDNKRICIYNIHIKAKNNENISIRIFKYNLKANSGQSINIYEQNYDEIKEVSNMNLTKLYEIVLNSNTEIPDIYNLKIMNDNKNLEYKINVLKAWKYDFKDLYEKNMILLCPLKVLDLKHRLVAIKNEIKELPKNNIKILPQKNKLKNYIKDETDRFFNNMNIFIEKAKNQGIIYEKDILKFNLTAIELLNYLNEEENFFLDMNEIILANLKNKYIK